MIFVQILLVRELGKSLEHRGFLTAPIFFIRQACVEVTKIFKSLIGSILPQIGAIELTFGEVGKRMLEQREIGLNSSLTGSQW